MPVDSSNSTRLNKFLALHMGLSRRQADNLITAGKVTINGKPAGLGVQVNGGDKVAVSGQPISGKTELVYIAFNKPRGYVCSRRAQGDTPTIYDILPSEYRQLKTVGRLDKDSSGLLILTNDGDFAQSMTHPSNYKVKRYEIALNEPLQPLHQQMISDFGIELPDGPSKLSLERVDDERKQWIVVMSEGRNRQIRRTFAALGYTVIALHRTNFGLYALGDIKPGKTLKVAKIT